MRRILKDAHSKRSHASRHIGRPRSDLSSQRRESLTVLGVSAPRDRAENSDLSTRARSPFPSGLNRANTGLIVFGFAAILGAFFLNLWKQPEYQFFPQALAAAGYFAWSRLKEVERPFSPGAPGIILILMLAALLGLALATFIWSLWIGAVAAMFATVGLLWWHGGGALLRKMVPALVMCLTVLPPPLGLDLKLNLFLRHLATVFSSRSLDLLGVIHSVNGNVIELPGQKLLVEEACSGINSVLFATAFCLFYLLWKRRAAWCYIVCVPLVLVFVVMGNIVRIALGAWLQYHDSIDILTGWKHEVLSMVLVVIYIVLVVSLESLLPASAVMKSRPPGQPASRRVLRPVWAWMAAVVFAILGLVGCVRAWDKYQNQVEPLRAASSALPDGARFHLPDHIGEWKRRESGEPPVKTIETLGLSSAYWTFDRPGLTAVVALDYPIWGYHDVVDCYTRIGWVLDSKTLITPADGAPPFFLVELQKEPAGRASLWFGTINEQGEWVDTKTVKQHFFGRLEGLGMARQTTYRVQVLLVGANDPTLPERKVVAELYRVAADKLAQQLNQQLRR